MTKQQMKQQFFDRIAFNQTCFEIFEHTPDLNFFFKNRKGEVMGANQFFVKLMGGKKENDIIGKTAYDLCPLNLADNYTQDDEEVMGKGKHLTNRLELNYGDSGGYSWFITYKSPLYDNEGNIIGLVGLTRDTGKTQLLSMSYDELLPTVEYIQTHFRKNINIAELAKNMGMSQSKMEHRFRKQFGLSPLQYVMRQRVNAAAEMLIRTNKSIAQIAIEVGFYDHSALTRNFIKHKNITPKAYRKNKPAS
jgi:AraC-like DNA-binding protein